MFHKFRTALPRIQFLLLSPANNNTMSPAPMESISGASSIRSGEKKEEEKKRNWSNLLTSTVILLFNCYDCLRMHGEIVGELSHEYINAASRWFDGSFGISFVDRNAHSERILFEVLMR